MMEPVFVADCISNEYKIEHDREILENVNYTLKY